MLLVCEFGQIWSVLVRFRQASPESPDSFPDTLTSQAARSLALVVPDRRGNSVDIETVSPADALAQFVKVVDDRVALHGRACI